MARIIDAFTQFFDNAGDPLIYGKLKFLESGTNNTDKNTFKDAALTPGMENTNPVILDGAGRLAFSVSGTGTYNVILFDSDDVQIQQFDPVGATSSGSQFSVWLATETYDKGDIVRATDNEYYQSFINDNNNNNPISNPATWDLITIVKSYIANASGTVDAITVDFVPVMHSLVDKTRILVRSSGTNTTTNPTVAPNGLTAKTIVKDGNTPLLPGDIPGEMDMAFNASNDNWELLNPSTVPYQQITPEVLAEGQDWAGATYTDPDAVGANPTAKIYPDGTVVGETDNGKYTKYPNGDLICYDIPMPTIDFTVGAVSFSAMFPVAFIDTPAGGYNSLDTASASRSLPYGSMSVIHSTTFANLLVGAVLAATASGFKSFATGRWK
ncbi:MAG: hypothetical protein JKY50_00860 [Oleispira sp.]|nr:hypothetical protein [Oleispira sp.]